MGLPSLNFGGWSEELCKDNFAHLLSLIAMAVYLHGVIVSESDVLEAG